MYSHRPIPRCAKYNQRIYLSGRLQKVDEPEYLTFIRSNASYARFSETGSDEFVQLKFHLLAYYTRRDLAISQREASYSMYSKVFSHSIEISAYKFFILLCAL